MLERLQIEMINRCNYRCPLCRTLRQDDVIRRRMSLDELSHVIAPAAGSLRAITLYGTRGEPFLHPDIEKAVALIKQRTSASVDISSNGSLITAERAQKILDAGLDRLIFAIDGVSEDSYQRYRVGGTLAHVSQNLARLCALKQKGNYSTKIVFQLIVMSSNEHELEALPAYAAELGADEVTIKISSSVTRDRALRPRDRRHHGRRRSDAGWDCPFGLDKLYVDPNGDCYSCCYGEGLAHMRVGNAFSDSVLSIYEHATLRHIRRGFELGRDHHHFCVERCAQRPVVRKRRLRLVG